MITINSTAAIADIDLRYLPFSCGALVIFNSFTRPFHGEWKSRFASYNRIKETFYDLLYLHKKISMKLLKINLDLIEWRWFDKINYVSFNYNRYNDFLYTFPFRRILFYYYYIIIVSFFDVVHIDFSKPLCSHEH